MESESANATPHGSINRLQRMQTSQGRTSGPTRRSTKGQWTAEEDEVLRRAVERFGGKNWKKIAECCKDRTDVQCLHRWQKVLNPELVKGPWTKEEDEAMVELVKTYGAKKWSTIAQHLPGRIGKQCRERWHNHLNPQINKEAWTQEEELILIRAHQNYGNKWAELTKFLPGRSDNSIKNHWNSSVRKKLDTYLASGLLSQFQGLPHIGETSQAVPSPSSTVPQSSGDDSVLKDVGTENEEISVCSQGLSVFGARSINDIPSAVRDNRRASNLGIDPTPNSEEIDVFSGQEVPFEIGGSSNILDHSYSNDMDMDLGEDFLMHCIGVPENHESVPFPLQNSVGLTAPSMDKPDDMISEDDCYRLIFSDAETDRNYVTGNPTEDLAINEFNGSSGSLLQLLDNQNPGPLRPDVLGITYSQCFPHESALCHDGEFNGCNNIINQSGEMELGNNADDGIIFTSDSIESPCRGHEYTVGAEDELDNGNEPLNLVAVDLSNLSPLNNQQSFATSHDPGHANNSLNLDSDEVPPSNIEACPRDDRSLSPDGTDAGSLCYEPPRFPSLDIPFFSCDLAQPGDHMQQEYSPLGIRQLLMSSQISFSPVRLWDSPKHDGNTEDVLKNAAKTFSGTPSILKKRNHDCVSPISERSEKKIEIGMDRYLLSNLAKDFSRREEMFSEKENQMLELSEYKENVHHVSNIKANSQKVNKKNIHDEAKPGKAAAIVGSEGDSDAMTNNVSHPPGVLVEHDMNDMLIFSPEQSENISDNIAFGNHRTEKFDSNFKQGSLQESSLQDPYLSVVSPTVSKTNDKCQFGGAMSGQSPLALELPEVMAQSNGGCSENLSMLGETPFQMSFESPSAWKSPWFINSFTPGPRVDTDITIEDIGYFLSPGDKSVDAIGLMKELGEHNAHALADVRKFWGDEFETPEAFVKYRRSIDRKGQGNSAPKCQTSAQSLLESSLLKEKRVLDFSNCGTPGKSKQKAKTSTAVSSSPSSYLLKGCR